MIAAGAMCVRAVMPTEASARSCYSESKLALASAAGTQWVATKLNFFDGRESVTHVGTQGRVVDHLGFEIAHRDWTECSKSVLSES